MTTHAIQKEHLQTQPYQAEKTTAMGKYMFALGLCATGTVAAIGMLGSEFLVVSGVASVGVWAFCAVTKRH